MPEPRLYRMMSQPERAALRREYIKEQGGRCYYCKAPLTEKPPSKVAKLKIDKRRFPSTFFKFPVHLHHCHVSGFTLGAVHAHCNAVLWQYHGE